MTDREAAAPFTEMNDIHIHFHAIRSPQRLKEERRYDSSYQTREKAVKPEMPKTGVSRVMEKCANVFDLRNHDVGLDTASKDLPGKSIFGRLSFQAASCFPRL